MKKTLSMALTVVMMFVMGITVFAAELPGSLPTDTPGAFDSIIDFFADILRWFGDIIAVIFK
jgi:hypothetical protein